MGRAAALLPLCILLALPAVVHGQQGGRIIPYVGLSVGPARLPTEFESCGDGGYTAGELRGGVARGALAVEARVAAIMDLSVEVCALDPAVFPDGVHTGVYYPDRDGAAMAADLRLRLGGTRAMPLSVSAGTGWLRPSGVPYLAAGAGVRFGGRLRLALDAERSWYRTRRVEDTMEWKDYTPVRLISRLERREWLDGMGVRAGVDLPFR
ncbi:MAG TPA: hypothetical protein VGR37_06320 [Longimicrobiaceae bacterium]|nr:hypothetical protein [Longimicrobiaceae bacterium]